MKNWEFKLIAAEKDEFQNIDVFINEIFSASQESEAMNDIDTESLVPGYWSLQKPKHIRNYQKRRILVFIGENPSKPILTAIKTQYVMH